VSNKTNKHPYEHIDSIPNGDTVHYAGISGILIKSASQDVGILPVPMPKDDMTEDMIEELGVMFQEYMSGRLKLYHLDTYEQSQVIQGRRVVLVEKTIESILRGRKVLKYIER
jgi:hypothetical protein